MSTDIKLPLAQATNATVRGHFADGFARFIDGKVHYCVADMKRFRFDVFRRSSAIAFTETIRSLPLNVRAAINGQYFGGGYSIYATTIGGAADPTKVQSIGSVVDDGKIVLTDEADGYNYYHFGRNADATAYHMALGNPLPPQIHEGMGGLGPIIGPKDYSGIRVLYGNMDLYGGQRKPGEKPTSAEEWEACVQRNSYAFRSIQGETADGVGVPILASNTRDGLLLVLAKMHGTEGDLEFFRDTLWELGYECAAFCDGSTSTCLAIDGDIVVKPADFKDGAIEAGFALFDTESSMIRLEVTIESVEVLKTVNWASEDLWTIQVTLGGSTMGQTYEMKVEVGMVIPLGWVTVGTFGNASARQIELGLRIRDRGGVAEMVADYVVEYGLRSEPKWKIGRWTLEDVNGNSRLTFSIRVLS